MQVAQQQQQQSSWTESAFDWWQRSNRARAVSSAAPPTDPASAAWAFCRPISSSRAAAGTGIAFIDAALLRQQQQQRMPVSSLPVIDIRGGESTGKTWTMLSLAARFAVATRPSQFNDPAISNNNYYETENAAENHNVLLPQVIILDSKYDVTIPKLSYAVRSTLLRKMSSSTQQPDDDDPHNITQQQEDSATAFERDMKDCLSRIHVGTIDDGDLAGWVPLLECIRHQLTEATAASEHPTLILWDGFLSEQQQQQSNNSGGEAARMEVIRQLERLLLECSDVLLVTTTTGSINQYRPREYERLVTHRIRLDRNETSSSSSTVLLSSGSSSNHEYLATVHGTQIPFSISMAGILS